jgi:predicted  nucleic acid-binding Zn-ribbon protein
MYSVAQMQIKEGIQSTNSERSLNQIHALVEQIKQLESNISRMSGEIIVNQEKLQSGVISDEEVEQLRAEVQQKVTQYKMLLNDKSALYEEMYSSALTMINRDKQIIKNEEEIVQLKHEIDINILEIE